MRSGVVWGAVFGFYVAVQALAYTTSYRTKADRLALVKDFGSNTGISALVGPARNIDTVAGYTVWKCLAALAIIGAVWGLLTATRLLRGEEDAGRWELLLAGHVTRRRAAAEGLVGLGAGLLVLYALTGAFVVVIGRSSTVGFSALGSLYFALAIVAAPAVFLAVGALASQLAATRRQAASYAAGVLGASYAIRMVADSGTGLTWLRWVSPMGWVEQLQPLDDPRPLALVPIALSIVVLCVLTVVVAGRRDLGASILPDRSRAEPHLGLLHGPIRLALRMQRPVLIGWALGITAYGLLLGSIARTAGNAITSSPSLRAIFQRLGVSGPEAYVGIALLIMAVLLAIVAAGQVSATRVEESSGRLEYLLVRPVSRTRWLTGRLALSATVLVAGAVLAGAATWVGAASEHAGIGLPTLLEAGLNIAPPALLVLGLGVLAFGVAPRAATTTAYVVVVWSFLVDLLGGISHLNHWVLDTSAFHQMAAAPSAPVDWTVDAVLVALAAAAAALGCAAFSRRDVTGE